MNITGVVVIDLARFVDDNLLQFRDSQVVDLWRAAGDPKHELELYIGTAEWVHWPPRLVEALQDVAHVRVVGQNSRGVEMAIRGLEQLLGRGAA